MLLRSFSWTRPQKPLSIAVRCTVSMADSVHEEYNGYRCPRHKVVDSTTDYEERRYDTSLWVSTKAISEMYSRSSYPVFKRLLGYISGGNEDSVKIPMTVPVISKVDGDLEEAKMDAYEMSFFLGQEGETFKAPSNDDVYLQTISPLSVYCMKYGGYNSVKEVQAHLTKLRDALDKDGKKYHTHLWYSAGYDSPWKFFGRRNEVWLLKQEEEEK